MRMTSVMTVPDDDVDVAVRRQEDPRDVEHEDHDADDDEDRQHERHEVARSTRAVPERDLLGRGHRRCVGGAASPSVSVAAASCSSSPAFVGRHRCCNPINSRSRSRETCVRATSPLLGVVPAEEDDSDDHPQDYAGADLHDQAGDAHVVERREPRTGAARGRRTGTAGARRTSGTTRGSSARPTAGTGTASAAAAASRGTSGSGLDERHPHDQRRHEDSACSAKWMSAVVQRGVHHHRDVRDDHDEVEQDRGGHEPRQRSAPTRSSHGGESSPRASHVGVPSSSSGAAMIEYTRCCTMCTENR